MSLHHKAWFESTLRMNIFTHRLSALCWPYICQASMTILVCFAQVVCSLLVLHLSSQRDHLGLFCTGCLLFAGPTSVEPMWSLWFVFHYRVKLEFSTDHGHTWHTLFTPCWPSICYGRRQSLTSVWTSSQMQGCVLSSSLSAGCRWMTLFGDTSFFSYMYILWGIKVVFFLEFHLWTAVIFDNGINVLM